MSTPTPPLLGVNIDHVATVRNARGGSFPSPVAAALACVAAGADIITFHLREDRRHIRDADVEALKAAVVAPLNFEAAVTDEMLGVIERTRPAHVALVPERRAEVTTEGGLDVAGQASRMAEAVARLTAAGCRVSLFIDADARQIEAATKAGAACVELHTGPLAECWWAQDWAGVRAQRQRLEAAVTVGQRLGLRVHAGHGLALWGAGADGAFRSAPPGGPLSSTASVASLPGICELHIGHALVGRAVFVGLAQAVRDFKAEIAAAAP
jgi:pyridoxine 5-phosphate synthase